MRLGWLFPGFCYYCIIDMGLLDLLDAYVKMLGGGKVGIHLGLLCTHIAHSKMSKWIIEIL